MKKINLFVTSLTMAALLAACGAQPAASSAPAPASASASAQSEVSSAAASSSSVSTSSSSASEVFAPKADPLYADQIAEGTYEITVNSSSSMFRVVKCELTVESGSMQATMTMSGQGYGKVYMGTGEQALADDESAYIPFVLNAEGEKTFTVPVEALNKEIDCTAWSIKKEKWYDRVLIFDSELIPAEALIAE